MFRYYSGPISGVWRFEESPIDYEEKANPFSLVMLSF